MVDAFGSFSDDGRARTLSFNGGESRTLTSADGFDADDLGVGLLFG